MTNLPMMLRLNKAVEKRTARKHDPKAMKRLYSPASKEISEEKAKIKLLQKELDKTESFVSGPNKSQNSRSKYSSEKNVSSNKTNIEKYMKQK
jgi:hypothetical protein